MAVPVGPRTIDMIAVALRVTALNATALKVAALIVIAVRSRLGSGGRSPQRRLRLAKRAFHVRHDETLLIGRQAGARKALAVGTGLVEEAGDWRSTLSASLRANRGVQASTRSVKTDGIELFQTLLADCTSAAASFVSQ